MYHATNEWSADSTAWYSSIGSQYTYVCMPVCVYTMAIHTNIHSINNDCMCVCLCVAHIRRVYVGTISIYAMRNLKRTAMHAQHTCIHIYICTKTVRNTADTCIGLFIYLFTFQLSRYFSIQLCGVCGTYKPNTTLLRRFYYYTKSIPIAVCLRLFWFFKRKCSTICISSVGWNRVYRQSEQTFSLSFFGRKPKCTISLGRSNSFSLFLSLSLSLSLIYWMTYWHVVGECSSKFPFHLSFLQRPRQRTTYSNLLNIKYAEHGERWKWFVFLLGYFPSLTFFSLQSPFLSLYRSLVHSFAAFVSCTAAVCMILLCFYVLRYGHTYYDLSPSNTNHFIPFHQWVFVLSFSYTHTHTHICTRMQTHTIPPIMYLCTRRYVKKKQ